MAADVGIVMPVYRQKGSFLYKAIHSMRRQSYRHFHLVIVLDGAPSRMAQIVRRTIGHDKRIHVITLPKNGGVANALNRGFEYLAHNRRIRYLTWVSSDNVYHKDFIEALRRTLRHGGSHVGLAYSAFHFIKDDGQPVFDEETENAHALWMNQPKQNLLESCFIGASFLYKRRFAKKIVGYRWEPVEDYEYWLRLTEQCDIAYCGARLMDYRYDSELSLTRSIHGTASGHRRWREAFETVKLDARRRRGIPPELSVLCLASLPGESSLAGLESLYEQSFSNFEVLIVDTSPDSSIQTQAAAMKDPRSTWMSCPNMDPVSAVLTAFEATSAPLILLHGANHPIAIHHVRQLMDSAYHGVVSPSSFNLEELRPDLESLAYGNLTNRLWKR